MASKIKINNANGKILAITNKDTNFNDKEVDIGEIALTRTTVADMIAIVAPSDNDVCVVTDKNQGGTFVYDSSKITEDNKGTIFNGWVRQYSGAVNVKWFGAKSSTSQDINPYLLLALKLEKPVIIDDEYYTVSQIDVSNISNIHIFGGGSIIFNPDVFIDDWIRVNSTNNCTSFLIDDITFVGNSLTKSAPVSQIFNVDSGEFRNCTFDRSFPAIKNSINVKYTNNNCLNWRQNGSGIIASGEKVVITNNVLIINEDKASDDAIVVNTYSGSDTGSLSIIVCDNTIDKSAAIGSYCRNGIAVNGAYCKNIVISSNTIKGLNYSDVNTRNCITVMGGTSSAENIIIANNVIKNSINGIYLDKEVNSVSINNNIASDVINPIFSSNTTKNNISVTNNIVKSSTLQTSTAIGVLYCIDSIMSNNIIYNYGVGIDCSFNHFNVVNNTLTNCTIAILLNNHYVPNISFNKFEECSTIISATAANTNRELMFSNNELIQYTSVIDGVSASSTRFTISNNHGVENRNFIHPIVQTSGSVVLSDDEYTLHIQPTGDITLYQPSTVNEIGMKRKVMFTQGSTGYTVTISSNINTNGVVVDSSANSSTYMEFMCIYIDASNANNNIWVLV